MIFIAGGTLAFFFELLLLSKKNKTLADKILAFWMLFIGIHLFLFYYTYKGLVYKYTMFLGIMVPFPFLHGPMLYLYTASLTGKIEKFKLYYFLHFIPFAFFYIYYAPFFTMDPAEKIAFVQKYAVEYKDIYTKYSYPILLISAVIYLTLTFIILRKHKKNIQDYFSYSNDKINLSWLNKLLIGMVAIWVVVFIANLFIQNYEANVFIYSTVVLFVIMVGYFGIKQGVIFISGDDNVASNLPSSDNTEAPQKRYIKSGLKEADAEIIQMKLASIMEDQKAYLDETLSLNKLSSQLEILPNYISQVINERFGCNFYDFVNSYRIEEFKKQVQKKDNKNKTLLAIAMESGFTSKASFNNSFKKITGQTPTEYIRSVTN